MCEQKKFICKHCQNMVSLINDSGMPISCCGSLMEELIPDIEETVCSAEFAEGCK